MLFQRHRLLTALACLFALPLPAGAAPARPNIVFILADDLGWTDLACYGSDLHETPNLDRLARQGMRFTAAYAAAPVCSPTRASIMTGTAPARLHITTWYESSRRPPTDRKLLPPVAVADLPLGEITVAEALKPAGYLTAHVGKWHLGDAAHYPEAQGFDINIGGTFWGAPATHFYPYRGLAGNAQEYRYVPHLEWGKEGEYLADRLTAEAIGVLERAGGRPFFLNLAHHAVHTPIEGKPALVEHYRAKLKPGLRHRNPDYAAMVHNLDENVGRVLAKLDALGFAENSIVIFTSDNGGYINSYRGLPVTDNAPLRSGKGSLYEGGLRVPLIVRWPGRVPAGASCDEPTVSTDLFATMLEAAGRADRVPPGSGAAATPGEPAAPPDGRSLVPLLTGGRFPAPRDALFWHYPHYYPTTTPVSAVRAGDWKLLEYFEDGRVELYNLREDLGESRDLAPSNPDKVNELRARLHAWRRDVGAQLPAPRPAGEPR